MMKDKEIFSLAEDIAKDLLNKGGTQMLDGIFGVKKTAFGKLIESQQKQVNVISDAYEEELKDLQKKIDELESKLTSLEIKNQELADVLKRQKSEKKPKKEKEVKNEEQQSSLE